MSAYPASISAFGHAVSYRNRTSPCRDGRFPSPWSGKRDRPQTRWPLRTGGRPCCRARCWYAHSATGSGRSRCGHVLFLGQRVDDIDAAFLGKAEMIEILVADEAVVLGFVQAEATSPRLDAGQETVPGFRLAETIERAGNGGQGFRDGVHALHARNFFDEVHFAAQVGTPARGRDLPVRPSERSRPQPRRSSVSAQNAGSTSMPSRSTVR